jgi:hypothetical protein
MQCVRAGSLAAKNMDYLLARQPKIRKEISYALIKKTVEDFVVESFSKPLTKVIKFTGPAMAPVLNRSFPKDHTSYEYLLMHRNIAPSPRNVLIGDVICFKHPLRGVGPNALMVRRVVVCGGGLLESEDAQMQLAPDTVWVTADNPKLEPPDVEDSRTFGPLHLDRVIGRCIYAIRSKTDRELIVNNPRWREDDKDVVAVELTDDLLKELDDNNAA